MDPIDLVYLIFYIIGAIIFSIFAWYNGDDVGQKEFIRGVHSKQFLIVEVIIIGLLWPIMILVWIELLIAYFEDFNKRREKNLRDKKTK